MFFHIETHGELFFFKSFLETPKMNPHEKWWFCLPTQYHMKYPHDRAPKVNKSTTFHQGFVWVVIIEYSGEGSSLKFLGGWPLQESRCFKTMVIMIWTDLDVELPGDLAKRWQALNKQHYNIESKRAIRGPVPPSCICAGYVARFDSRIPPMHDFTAKETPGNRDFCSPPLLAHT